jgi:subtilisin family serine protease
MVGSEGPAGLNGIARGATVFPIRVAGWQQEAGGTWALYGRTDQLVAGLERAVDPNADGVALDAARVALVGVAEPFAAFEDSPSARAVAGALRLDTLVVTAAGNDGIAGPGYGSISGPGGSRAALTVGAADLRESSVSVHVVIRTGLGVSFDQRVPLVGAVAPRDDMFMRLGTPRLKRSANGNDPALQLSDFFDERGFSYVAGRAALVPAGADPGYAASLAAKAGAALVVVYGDALPGGGIGLHEGVTVPVVTIPGWAGIDALDSFRSGKQPLVSAGRARGEVSKVEGRVAPFSSRGLAFDGFVKPDLVAPGVSLLTADSGKAEDNTARYSSLSGSSAAAAVVAGAAALLAQSRPELDASALKGLLAGSARPLSGESVVAQGAGLLDLGAAGAGEVAALPTTMSFGRATGNGWHATRKLVLRNHSSRALRLRISTDERDKGGGRGLVFAFAPARIRVPPGGIARVFVAVRSLTPDSPPVEGMFEVSPQGSAPIRVPWLVRFRPRENDLLRSVRLSSSSFRPSDNAPAVLSFQAGRIASGGQLEPVARLDLALRGPGGARLGVLAQLRDLLPGRYAFGLTGRDADGEALEPGRYRVKLTAHPTGEGTPSRAEVAFVIR